VGIWHTPDYFVIRSEAAGWEEWKTEVGLERLAETMPHRYLRDETGHWRCPPGERLAERFGLYYRLCSSAAIDWVLQRNLRFLEDYLALETAPVDLQSADAILKLVEEQPGLHLDALVGQLTNASVVDDIYELIARNRIYVDLHAAPLAEPERVRVFRDADLARAYELVGMQAPAKGHLSGEAHGQLARASPAELREANRRYAILAPYLAGMPVGHSGTPARTIRDWLARWRTAERIHGCGFAGLLPRLSESGNRLRKLPEATLALIDEFVAADYETLKQKRKFAVYAALVRACEGRGVKAPSYKSFTAAANGRPRHEQVAKRQGPRAAAQLVPFYWELGLTTPRHGDRPFEVGHLDHARATTMRGSAPETAGNGGG
jgi:hypothetical protein